MVVDFLATAKGLKVTSFLVAMSAESASLDILSYS